MRNYLFAFLSLIIFQGHIKAQTFGANNAVWHYSVFNQFPPISFSPVEVTSSQAFLFNGYSCRNIIVHHYGCMSDTSYIIRESNDSVYYYLPGSNQFVMLYNYNAAVGDTQTIYAPDISGLDTSIQMVVTSVGSITINGSLKRTYDITYATPFHYFDFAGTVVEDIGNTFFLFPQWGFCDPIIYELRCYEDDSTGLYQVNSNLPCDTTIWLSANDFDKNTNISIAPNPFNSEFSITIKNQIFKKITFSLYDILGKLLMNSQDIIQNDDFIRQIDMNSFPKGVYVVVMDIEEQRYIQKVVKD